MKKLVLVVLASTLFGCQATPYRFAVTTEKRCSHPLQEITEIKSLKRTYSWDPESEHEVIDHVTIVYREKWTPINPFHWHSGVHTKCVRCGQKFCDHWVTEKTINRVQVVK